jgi:hypothetical protein
MLRTASETRSNGLVFWEKAGSVTLSTHGSGSAGEKIPASAFGLSTFEECGVLTKSDNTVVVVAAPSADRTEMLLKAAGTNAPASVTGTYNFVVKGY